MGQNKSVYKLKSWIFILYAAQYSKWSFERRVPGCPATGLDVDGGRVNHLLPHEWLIFKTFLLFPHLVKLPLCLSLFLHTFNMHYLTLSLFLLSLFLYFPPLSFSSYCLPSPHDSKAHPSFAKFVIFSFHPHLFLFF